MGADGRPVRARYVLTDVSVALAGRRLAEDARNGMVLLRVDGPLRSQSVVTGLYPQDTWSGKHVRYTRFSCTGGRLRVLLGSDEAPLLDAAERHRARGRPRRRPRAA